MVEPFAGLDVLAGLAETALSEDKEDWDLADPPPLDLGGFQGRRAYPPTSLTYAQLPQAQPYPQAHAHAQTYTPSHMQSYAAQSGQGTLPGAPGQGHYDPQALSLASVSVARQLPGQLHAPSPADSSHFAGSSQQAGLDMPLSRHQGQSQQAGHSMVPPQSGRFQSQPHPGPFKGPPQGLPQYQGQQPGHLHTGQQSHQPAQQYPPHPPNFPQGCSQPPRPGLFQPGQPQEHARGPSQQAAAQCHRHLQQQQQQQQIMGSSEGIIRPQAVRSQGWAIHRAPQHGPVGQPQAPAALLGHLGPACPQSLPLGQDRPYSFGAGPPSMFQGSHGPHTRQGPSQPALPGLSCASGPGHLAVAPGSRAVVSSPHPHDQAAVHQGVSSAQHASNAPHYGQSITQYGGPQHASMPQHGQSVPQHGQSVFEHGQSVPQHGQSVPQHGQSVPEQGQSMPQHGQSMPQQGQSLSQIDQSKTHLEQEALQPSQVMPQPAATEAQVQPVAGTNIQHPSLGSVQKVLPQLLGLAQPCTSRHACHPQMLWPPDLVMLNV